ncbi:MAG: hypothetical protein ACJAYK_002496 [Crocinitomicaceae bacterium]|jgi:hypothetical protein
MKYIVFAVSFFCSALFIQSSHAYNVSNVELPNIIPANAERPELQLNGASVRELYLLIETYVGALYLEEPSTRPSTIIKNDSHKRMVFHIMLKKVGARRTASALQEALLLNLSEEDHMDLSDEIEQMLSYFTGKMYAGEQSVFDYIPGTGTRITINGEVKGVIPGKKYFDAMLSIWIGKNPVGRDFKDDILGLNNDTESTLVAKQKSL